MEVSNHEVQPDGLELLQTVATLTGLPEKWVRQELDQIVKKSGQDSGNITLDQLREVLAAYLETIQADLLAENPPASE